jgi:beta-phosphoglucomutase-like phosphatase (HAD superfamily)
MSGLVIFDCDGVLVDSEPISLRCVVEDSIHGARAGTAAGMTVLGFIGGSHIRGNAARERSHGEKLIQAGAAVVFDKLADLPELVRELSR